MGDGGGARLRVVRDRRVLKVLDRAECVGFVVPHHEGVAAYRGDGAADYACGRCGTLLAIGVRPGMFRSLVFACACGALNALDEVATRP